MLGLAKKLRTRLVNLPRRHKRLLQVATDVVLVWVSLWLAFVVRLGDSKAIEPFFVMFAGGDAHKDRDRQSYLVAVDDRHPAFDIAFFLEPLDPLPARCAGQTNFLAQRSDRERTVDLQGG